MTFLKKILRNEGGATAIEYALVTALISISIITAANVLGGDLGADFTNIASALVAAMPGA